MYVTGKGTDGYGTILPAILEYYRDTPYSCNIHIVGTNSNSAENAKQKALSLMQKMKINLNINFYPDSKNDNDSYKDIISRIKELKCAIVAVPDHLHYEVIKFCLLKGLHTLTVKPFTLKTKHAIELVEIAKNKKLYGAVEFHKRWDNQNIFTKNSLDSGKIGKLLYTTVEYSQKKIVPNNYFKNWANKTNIFQYLGVHYIDLIHFITKAVPLRVMAIGQKNLLLKNNIDTYDSIQSFIEWEQEDGNIFVQALHVNWIDPNNSTALSDQKMKLIGTEGRIELNQKDRGISIISDNSNLESINPDFSRGYLNQENTLFFKGYGINSVKSFIYDIETIINEDKPPNEINLNGPTFKSSLISVIVTQKASESLISNSSWISCKV